MYKLQIFKMNDYDWYAAESVEDALKAMEADRGEDYGEDAPVELSEADLDRLKYFDEDGIPVRTFREQLAKMIAEGEKFPCLFATTEN